jgi:AAA15 family ATPase/GTPase
MLKRIYIDNFRCLVNFELTVDSINLFLGENGSGKSTVFDVLHRIRAFATIGSKAGEMFSASDCTRWQTSNIQSFELEIEGNEGVYKYELAIEHDMKSLKATVRYERLWFDSQPLLKFELGKVEIYDDKHSKVSEHVFEQSQSIMPILSADSTLKLGWFRWHLGRFIIVQINPRGMSGVSDQEHTHPNPTMDNYFSWYRCLSQDQSKIFALANVLKEVLPGFTNFKFDKAGEQRSILKCLFMKEGVTQSSFEYSFLELSDGQRMLIALYTLICCIQSEDYTVCIDEPENFLALPEIQPWLMQLYDLCAEKKLQALLISHHPELIDILAVSNGYWFERQTNAPVRVKPIKDEHNTGLRISELIARGWLYD